MITPISTYCLSLPFFVIFATTFSLITKDSRYKLIMGHSKAAINTSGIIPQDPSNNAGSVFVPSNIELRSLSVGATPPNGTQSNMRDQSDSTSFESHLPGPLPDSSATTLGFEVQDTQTKPPPISKVKSVMVIATLAGISFLSALGSGIQRIRTRDLCNSAQCCHACINLLTLK